MNSNKQAITTAVRIHPGPNTHCDDKYVGAVGFGNYMRFGNQAVQSEQNDFVFGSDISQEIIFECAIKKYIDNFLRGQDMSIIAYGDHFTGKSYTIFGPGFNYTDSEIHFGMLPRAISYIFSKLEPCKIDCDTTWPPHITISIFEVFAFCIKDLFDTSGEVITLPTNAEKGYLTFNLTKKNCSSAMEAMQILNFGMHHRTIHAQTLQHLGTVVVKLELHRPEIKGGEIHSEAFFVDMACHNMVHPVTRNIIHFDVFILSMLATSHRNQTPTAETQMFQSNLHYKVFQDFFKGKMESLFICCISPRKSDIQETTLYMSVLWHIYKNKPLPQTERARQDELRENEMNQSQMSTMLMTQAERLFSQLSTNSSLADEERDMMRMWIELKQEIVDENVNAQNHPHLERIEEVTESEEEIASSDGRVSKQEHSEDNTAIESDQEDLDQKVCLLSESDFLENIEDMYETFCTYVDNEVETLTQPTLPPTRDLNPSCSATRREELLHLPLTVDFQDSTTAQGKAIVTRTNMSQNSSGVVSSGEQNLPLQDNNGNLIQNQPQREPAIPESNYEQDRLVVDFPRQCKLSDDGHHIRTSQGHLLEDNDDVANLAIIQHRLEDLAKKCQTILQSNNVCASSSSKGEEARAPSKRIAHFFETVKKINHHIAILECLASTNDGNSETDSVGNVLSLQDHRLRKFRSVREKVILSKNKAHAKIKSKIYYDEDVRSYLIADEMVEILDRGNEFLNCLRLNREIPYSHHDHLEIWKLTEECLHEILLPSEIKHLLTYYFIKVVDLRESTLSLETSVSSLEASLDACYAKIKSMNMTLVNLRSQKVGRREVNRYRSQTNKIPNNTLPMAEEQGACGGAGSSSIPQQNLSKLQVSNCEPPPRVMRSQNNKKLVVELNRKKR